MKFVHELFTHFDAILLGVALTSIWPHDTIKLLSCGTKSHNKKGLTWPVSSEDMAKILIVDDSPEIIQLFQEMVMILGHDVITAPGGAEGLQLVKTESPDVILLDLMMPDVDGWQFLERLPQYGGVPVIVVTADDSERNRQRALSLGAHALLRKELTPPILQTYFSELLTTVTIS